MAAEPNPWVIIAGAAGSLGRDLAQRYIRNGRRLLLLDRTRDTPAGASGAAPSASIVSRVVDLTDAAAVDQALAEAIPRGEAIGLLVNAAGQIWNEPCLALQGARFVAHDVDHWEAVLRANLTTAFVTATRVAARMARSGGGAIVNFSSISASGNAGQVAYSAAKAGIEGMTRAMARELGPLNIRVNAVAPGFIDVASTRSALAPTVLNDYVQRTPLRRLGTLDDLAAAIDTLEQNKFLTGMVLALDGGLRL